MQINLDNPVIVQADGKVLVEANHKTYELAENYDPVCRTRVNPDALHTIQYPYFLWNVPHQIFPHQRVWSQ